MLKIEALEWLIFNPVQRSEALRQANAMMRVFLGMLSCLDGTMVSCVLLLCCLDGTAVSRLLLPGWDPGLLCIAAWMGPWSLVYCCLDGTVVSRLLLPGWDRGLLCIAA